MALQELRGYSAPVQTNIGIVDHYTSLCAQRGKMKGEIIMLNIQKAAFHLRFLLMVCRSMRLSLTFSHIRQGHLDLPPTSKLLEDHLKSTLTVDADVITELENRWKMGRPKMGTIRHPLFFALACTPLVLLLGSYIDSKTLSMDKLFMVSAQKEHIFRSSLTNVIHYLVLERPEQLQAA